MQASLSQKKIIEHAGELHIYYIKKMKDVVKNPLQDRQVMLKVSW
jgi:hypothetical protein